MERRERERGGEERVAIYFGTVLNITQHDVRFSLYLVMLGSTLVPRLLLGEILC